MTETIIQTLNVSLDHNEDEVPLMSPAGYVAAAIVLFLIGFFGFFLNLCVLVVMWKDQQLWTPLNIILFNLVCSDFLVSIFGNPWTLVSALHHKWIFGTTMCIVYGFFMSLFGLASITTLTVLAFERYLIVSQPFKYPNLNKRGAIYFIIGIWIYALCLTVPPLFGWGKYVNEAANISCSVNWEEKTPNALSYILYLFFFGLILPLVIIIFSYSNIIDTMNKNKMRMGRVSKAEGHVAYMVLVMIATFLIAWSPYAIMALMIQFGDSEIITPAAGVLPALIAKSSICYNPIIYVGLNTQFRQSVKQIFGRKRDKFNSNCETCAVGVSRMMSHDAAEDILLSAKHKSVLKSIETERLATKPSKVRIAVGGQGEEFMMMDSNTTNNIPHNTETQCNTDDDDDVANTFL